MRPGIDRDEIWEPILHGRKCGLITNPTGVDSRLTASIDCLRPFLKCLFGPEHGIRAAVQDELHVDHSVDSRTGLPEYSLFGSVMAPTEDMLEGIDMILFDIQDVGVRFYTYGTTMVLSMLAAEKKGIGFAVFDRPNPLGVRTEGLIRDESFTSFLSYNPVCTRHGLTMGELALYMKKKLGLTLELEVIPAEGWDGDPVTDDRLWVPPSPNMPSLSTVRVYPGTCLIEGTSIAEGRGTTKPFEWIGAPWINGQKLADCMNELELPGCLFRPVSFTPLDFKHKGQLCQGIQLHVTDESAFRPVEAGVYLVRVLQKMSGSDFTWRYIPEYGHYMVDLLHGDDSLRKGAPVDEILGRMKENENSFVKDSQYVRLYGGTEK